MKRRREKGVILVTGAHGFIGAAVCRALSRSWRVRACVRRDAPVPDAHETVVCDLNRRVDASLLSGVGGAVHAAGLAHVTAGRGDAGAFHAANVDPVRHLVEACADAGVGRMVLVSSVSVVETGEAVESAEGVSDSPPQDDDPYVRSKRAAERVVFDGRIREPVAIRFPLVYGPHLPGNLARMIRAVSARRFPPPPRRSNRRSMIHVDDAAAAVALGVQHAAAPGGAYVATDGRPYSTREIYDMICAALGRKPSRAAVPSGVLRVLAGAGDVAGWLTRRRMPFDSRAYDKLFGDAFFDHAPICRDLGFAPRLDLASTIGDIVRSIVG